MLAWNCAATFSRAPYDIRTVVVIYVFGESFDYTGEYTSNVNDNDKIK